MSLFKSRYYLNQEKLKSSNLDKKPNTEKSNEAVQVFYIGNNNYVDIIAKACSVCWDKKIPSTLTDKITYISKRIKSGHTSILEHSNIVMAAKINTDDSEQVLNLIEFLSESKYLNKKIRTKDCENEKYVYVLIGGSLRGYFDLFDKTLSKNRKNNSIVEGIIDQFYNYSFRDFFIKYIDGGVIKDKFNPYCDLVYYNSITNIDHILDFVNSSMPLNEERNLAYDEKVHIANVDLPYRLLDNLNLNGIDCFLVEDMLDFITISVLFNKMSRTATHQLVRHRNAITQESQRYVDYSDATFVSPCRYNNKLKNRKFTFKFNEYIFCMTLEQLGKEMCTIYRQLIKPEVMCNQPKLRREEARSFLPSNVACNKLYMTFTLRNFFKFIQLRTEPGAQAEIRDYANLLKKFYEEYFNKNFSNVEGENISISYDPNILNPLYERE